MIRINENWFIVFDNYSYTLRETYLAKDKVTKELKEAERVHGYYSTIGFALKKYAELNVGEQESINAWLDRYETLTKQLIEIGEKQ